MIDRNEVLALAGSLAEARKKMHYQAASEVLAVETKLHALAASADANSPALAGLREMAQRLRTEFNMPGTAARIEESALVLETSLAAKAEPQGGEVDDDRAALLYLMHQFDGEVHVCPCGREDPTGDCDSAIYLREYLRTHPAPKPAEGEVPMMMVPVEPTR